VKVAKPVALYAKGDIGGFGAASDFTWQVQGGVEFQVTRCLYSDVGWRYMKYDYTSGGFTNKTELNGPYIESGINF
jgi:opacity protein-like surface antigen